MKLPFFLVTLLFLIGCSTTSISSKYVVTEGNEFWIERRGYKNPRDDGYWYCKGIADDVKPPTCSQAVMRHVKTIRFNSNEDKKDNDSQLESNKENN